MEEILKDFGEPFIRTDDQIRLASEKGTFTYAAIETILKGPELDLRKYEIDGFVDNGGHHRHNARISWWLDGTDKEHMLQGPDLRAFDQDIVDAILKEIEPYRYVDESKPLFFGHYWQNRKHEEKLATMGANAACVDFSAGKEGQLTAYRHIPGRPTTLDGYQRERQGS
jgi:hypothetical protein